MAPQYEELRRKLAGLRRLQTRTYLALKSAGHGIGARLARVKLDSVNRAIRDVAHRLRHLGK